MDSSDIDHEVNDDNNIDSSDIELEVNDDDIIHSDSTNEVCQKI